MIDAMGSRAAFERRSGGDDGGPARQSPGMAAQMEFDAGPETVGSCRERFEIGLKKLHGSDRQPVAASDGRRCEMATSGNRRNTALKEAMTKTQLLNALSESTGLHKKEVALVLDELGLVIERHIKRRAVGTFTLPGLLKIKAVRKPARKARKMISPFTGEEITVTAKPASRSVKVQPLSGLKRMVE